MLGVLKTGALNLNYIIIPAVAPWTYTFAIPVFTPDSATMASTCLVMS